MQALHVLDLDHTLCKTNSGVDFLEYLHSKGFLNDKAWEAISEHLREYRVGEVGYYETSARIIARYAKELKGASASDLAVEAKRFAHFYSANLYPFAKPLIRLLQQSGKVAVITNSLEPASIELTVSLAPDLVAGTRLEEKNGKLSGEIAFNMARVGMKAWSARNIAEREGFSFKKAFGMGDSEHDAEFLRLVEHAVIVNPTKGLKKIAKDESWPELPPSDDLADQVRQMLS